MGQSAAHCRYMVLGTLMIFNVLQYCSCLRIWPPQGIHQPQPLGDFPPFERIWEGGNFTYLGSGTYYKKILFISVQASKHCCVHCMDTCLMHVFTLGHARCRCMRQHCTLRLHQQGRN